MKLIKITCFCVALLFVLLEAAATSQAQSTTKPRMEQNRSKIVTPGEWGGTGIKLVVEKERLVIELDCAEAAIDEPFRTDKNGKFVFPGSVNSRGPGPIRLGFKPPHQPAVFSGTVKGKTMKLKIILDAGKQLVGEYKLERSAPGTLRRCL